MLFCLLETKAYYTDSVPLCSVLPPLRAPCFLTKSQTLRVPTVMPNELFGQQTLVPLVPCCGLSPGSPGNRMTCSYLQLDNPAPILCSCPRTWPICLSFKLLVPYPRPPLSTVSTDAAPHSVWLHIFCIPFPFKVSEVLGWNPGLGFACAKRCLCHQALGPALVRVFADKSCGVL